MDEELKMICKWKDWVKLVRCEILFSFFSELKIMDKEISCGNVLKYVEGIFEVFFIRKVFF